MQRQRKTRYKDKKDKEYRETGKTMCAGIFLSTLADWFDQKRCDVYSALPGTHVVSVISNPGFLANCLSCTSRTINAMLVNEHSVSIWDLFPTENPRGALHWQMFIIQIVNAFNVNWLKDLVLNGNKILVRLRGNTTRRASPCWTTSTPTARFVFFCDQINVVFEDCIMNVMFINNIDVISFIIIVVFKISFLWAMTIYII